MKKLRSRHRPDEVRGGFCPLCFCFHPAKLAFGQLLSPETLNGVSDLQGLKFRA